MLEKHSNQKIYYIRNHSIFEGISIYISPTLNPILYNVMSKRYRTTFKKTIQMIFSCSLKRKPDQHINRVGNGGKYSPGVTYKFNKNLNSATKQLNNKNAEQDKKYLSPSIMAK